jgi:tetratricopeptide (TPR) repeat protein
MSSLARFRPALFRSLAAALALTICGTPRLFAGEQQWLEVRSPNFSVVTDAGEKRGREVAVRFEQMRAVFGTLMTKAKINLPVPLQIVAFRNTKEMRQVAPLFNGKPTEMAGLFQQGEDRSFIMLDMSVENPWTVVFHEYAHQLMNGNLQGQFAPWFQEGFAEYFSTIEVNGKEARVGRIPEDEYRVLLQLGWMKISDLFKVQQNSATYNESGDHRSTFYAESGMLMHYIYDNQLLPKVGTYFDLRENKSLPVEDAIQQAFGMNAAQFDKALRNYVTSGRYKYFPIPAPASISANSYTVTPLSAAGGNAVLADIHLHSRDYQERALHEFEDILKSDPNNAAACRGLGYGYLQKQNFSQAAEYFGRASLLDSKDPRVHYYNALLTVRKNGFVNVGNDGAAMIRELETSISLDPNFADSYALLAFAQSTGGDPAKALATMQKAIAISPRNEMYLFNLANLYLTNRQPDQAIAVLRGLQNSENPMLSSRVAAMLEQAQEFITMQRQPAAMNPMPVTRQPEEEPASTAVPTAAASGGAVKFLQGTLTHVDCSTPQQASFILISEGPSASGGRSWKMNVADRSHLIVIGADAFSCEWTKQKVAVNYRETAAAEGSVVSLEVQ